MGECQSIINKTENMLQFLTFRSYFQSFGRHMFFLVISLSSYSSHVWTG